MIYVVHTRPPRKHLGPALARGEVEGGLPPDGHGVDGRAQVQQPFHLRIPLTVQIQRRVLRIYIYIYIYLYIYIYIYIYMCIYIHRQG